MALKELFKKNKPKKMYYFLLLADKPLDKAKLSLDQDCKMMVAYGEANKDVVPRGVIEQTAEQFWTPEPQGSLAATNEKEKGKK